MEPINLPPLPVVEAQNIEPESINPVAERVSNIANPAINSSATSAAEETTSQNWNLLKEAGKITVIVLGLAGFVVLSIAAIAMLILAASAITTLPIIGQIGIGATGAFTVAASGYIYGKYFTKAEDQTSEAEPAICQSPSGISEDDNDTAQLHVEPIESSQVTDGSPSN